MCHGNRTAIRVEVTASVSMHGSPTGTLPEGTRCVDVEFRANNSAEGTALLNASAISCPSCVFSEMIASEYGFDDTASGPGNKNHAAAVVLTIEPLRYAKKYFDDLRLIFMRLGKVRISGYLPSAPLVDEE